MSNKAYTSRKCEICGQRVTNAGAGRVAHMRKHVREGAAKEITRIYGRAKFEKT